ncbi:uncharacterized protein LOC117304118 [Asterias rubens]|uniref:uncharacterized protein LOC117304118 n=1 Tax=Asterias rubens TaxID=7604 RepID=UPI0014554340|nr:uncharacterized protein LOC117304118 [Asterias rubens]
MQKMAKHLILVSIFLDDQNKLKKAVKVKNVKDIQEQAKKLYPVGNATLDRFMVYSNDFEEFVDVDKGHKVVAKEKYEFHYRSPQRAIKSEITSPNDISPTVIGRLRADPSLFNKRTCMTNQEVKLASQIFKKNVSKYHKGVNEWAHKIALEHPELLQDKGKLLKLSREALTQSGYKYSTKRVAKTPKVVHAVEVVVVRENTSNEQSQSAQTCDEAGPSETQQDDQPGSQPPEQSSSEQVNDRADDSSQVVANLEALVDTMIEDERRELTSASSPTHEAVNQEFVLLERGTLVEDNPLEDLNEAGVDLAELKKVSRIFGRNGNMNLTSYHTKMNEMAFRVALEKPHLLDKRGELYTEAQKRLYYSGYKYTRCNQTRSKLFQPGGFKREKHQTKKVRENRMAEIDITVNTLKEQVALITSEKTKLVISEWHERAEQLDLHIGDLQDKIVSLMSEKRQIIKKGEWSERKRAWAAMRREKKNKKRPVSWRPVEQEAAQASQLLEEMTE